MSKPILFSAPMVRAILAGRKTMTRRALKNQPVELPDFNKGCLSICVGGSKYTAFQPEITTLHCPHGKVGSKLWVRESWRTYKSLDHLPPRQIATGAGIQYEAGGSNVPMADELFNMGKLRPSIFMPRWASRINLELTEIRVERLNKISNTDILREGIRSESCNVCVHTGGSGCEHCFSILNPFRELWDSINGSTPGKAWDDNPFVFVESFKVV